MTTPTPAPTPAADVEVATLFEQGQLEVAETQLRAGLPANDRNRFALGVALFLRAVERFTQTLCRYGFDRSIVAHRAFDIKGAPVKKPETVSYEDLRKLVQTLLTDLAQVDEVLAEVKDPDVKLTLDLTRVRLDFNGDGHVRANESLWTAYAWLSSRWDTKEVKSFAVTFDRADVEWLRGYCHLLSALGELGLAYDEHDQFERSAMLWFPSVKTPYPWLLTRTGPEAEWWPDFLEVVAFIHTFNYPLVEPDRSRAALTHLQAMSTHSRTMWQLIQAEKDDDHEWIPNPKQKTQSGTPPLTPEMVTGWISFLDELDAILAGQKLIPFWREGTDQGVNLNRFFTDPRPFDLVMWIQGTGAQPYLETGDKTSKETWERFNRIFRGEFFGFAIWFN